MCLNMQYLCGIWLTNYYHKWIYMDDVRVLGDVIYMAMEKIYKQK